MLPVKCQLKIALVGTCASLRPMSSFRVGPQRISLCMSKACSQEDSEAAQIRTFPCLAFALDRRTFASGSCMQEGACVIK